MKKITIFALHLGTGGAEQSITSVANILSKDNEVEIISTYQITDSPAFYINPKVKVKYLKEGFKPNRDEFKSAIRRKNIFLIIKEGIKGINNLVLRKKLMIRAMKKCDSDVLITTRVLHNKWLGKYGKRESIKIAQEHNHHNNNSKLIINTIKSIRKFDYFMPVSKELCDFYADLLINTKTKCKYIPHSIENFPDILECSKHQGKTIISVGRFSKEKGFPDLIDVFGLVHDIDNGIKLKLVGDGEERLEIEKKIKDKKLSESVELCGFRSREELNNLYKQSDLYVMTSFTESFGLVLIEAESYELPLIVFDSAQGAKEIIEDGKNGFFIKNRSKELMAKKIIEVLNDKDKQIKLGLNGRKMAEKYKVENVSKEWLEFIKNI